ncbi:hypothetical protein H6F43_11720 [Leptolyngbya sp. FACHB-36]|uniref:hypothetical protein n=1 Tax=Leptolyngbya sp. FACHB-36 TaxID=2692808 RepID=UPI001680F640|nr:hypothetical protein [Leptolyngbya sp. FACHB-36]MBD2020848.1 hypothetical protein [Leptolyngbya sp. FACHB-36]
MIRRIALVSGCVALSALAFGGKAHAQSVDVDFNGVVTPTCMAANVVNGVTKVPTLPTLNLPVLSSDPADDPGASFGRFDLSCNGDADITINPPTVLPSSVATASTANYGASLKDGTIDIATAVKGGAPGTATVVGPLVNKTFDVHQWVNNGAVPLPSGNYDYRVNLNIVAK